MSSDRQCYSTLYDMHTESLFSATVTVDGKVLTATFDQNLSLLSDSLYSIGPQCIIVQPNCAWRIQLHSAYFGLFW